MDFATITKSISDIGAAATASGLKIDKALADLADNTTSQNARILDLEQKLASANDPARIAAIMHGGNPIPSIAKSIAADEKIQLLVSGGAERVGISVNQSLRAIVKSILVNSGQGVDSPGSNFPSAPQYVTPVPTQSPGRKLQVLQALPHMPVGGATAIVPKVSSVSDGSAVQAGEGSEKGQSTLDVVGDPMPLPTVATWLNLSKQLLQDVAALPAFLNDWLLFFVLRKLENLILSGNGTSDKILGLVNAGNAYVSTAQHGIDRIFSAASIGLPAGGYSANLIVMSTSDYFHTLSARDANERYVGPGWGVAPGGMLWGIPTVSSPGIATGTALVCDTSRIAIMDREVAQIFIGQTGSQFTENAVTALAELRANLALADPAAVMVVSLPVDSPREIG